MTNDGWMGSAIWGPLMNWVYVHADAIDTQEVDVFTERLNELDRRLSALERREAMRVGGNRSEI